MDQEVPDLGRERPARLPRLGRCLRHADHDVAEQRLSGERPLSAEGKRQDVGRRGDAAVVAVQASHRPFAHKDDAHPCVGAAEQSERALQVTPDAAQV